MKLSKSLLTLGLLTFALTGAIRVEANTPLRCPNGAFNDQKCEQVRQEALRNGCINQSTYEALKKRRRFPACVGSTNVGDCPCGCFAEDVLLGGMSTNGETEFTAKDLFSQPNRYRLSALQTVQSLRDRNPSWMLTRVSQSTAGREGVPLVVLTLDNERKIRLTEKHPVLVAPGKLITAREISKGNRLYDSEGKEVKITSIEREAYQGKVYNFEADRSDKKHSHLLLAEGVVVGDLFLQNAIDNEEQAITARR